ncbi:hypothetical protein HMPREF1214_02490 [Bacteroides sp. HPS0048]|jgi:hypothetical protein|uniref:DUF3127 domain-containing protein n=1 Tax=Bacteroides sp. HPS0048 TaxID=1078089 RepID=UPI00037A4A38|nr:DUF3127 domain-containing protein [Bacteroides sp. HPS0048]EOA57457.1 hypothetical protein HMPREF1214_02490 [Bacteroides sp. HPS0048]
MKISGRIIVALPMQGGTSKSGKEWSRQDYVIETKEQYPKKVTFSVMNDNIMNFGLAVGQDVDIEIDINASEWNGKWYNSISCWKATLLNPQQQPPAQPNYSAVPPKQQATPQPAQQQMFTEGQKDDLPF